MINKRLHTPEGVKDFKPDECAYKRKIEKNIEKVFISYGYKRVTTPTLEYEEVFDNIGSVEGSEKYRFISREGELLVLRSDMTPAICRMAATAFKNEDMPLRFYYIENIFRYNENNQGKQRELTQAGIELFGIEGINGDAEVLITAIGSLLNLNLTDFKIDIGHASFLEGAMEEAGICESDREKIVAAILDKDYITVSEIIKELDIGEDYKAFFDNLSVCLGDVSVLDRAEKLFKNSLSVGAISHLKELYGILKGCEMEKYICFDLGIVPQFEYYTGIIFRGYALGTGYSILSGGRYDRLCRSFDGDFSAVGFAVKINELMPVLETNSISFSTKKADTLLVYTDEGKFCALKAGRILRKSGMNIENFFGGIDDGLEYAHKKGYGGILYFIDDENVKIYNINEGCEDTMKIDDLLDAER